jgi:SAM-dependent methyltransferase
MSPVRGLLALAAVAVITISQVACAASGGRAAVSAAADAAAECESVFRPQVGQTGKDVIWVPTPDELVDKMLTAAQVTPQDIVVDLGAGDGKIAIAAAKRFGATAKGIEYNPDMVRLANCHVQAAGVADKVSMVEGDIFVEDFSQATVVTMYLLPELNRCVRHRLLAMRPGTRLTSHAFTMGEWEADAQFDAGYRRGYLWIVPARVGGNWRLRWSDLDLALSLQQSFQKVGGEITVAGNRQPLLGAALDGPRLRFSFLDDKGEVQHFSGTVDGDTIEGEIGSSGARRIAGTLQGALQPAPWAQMASGCERFYQRAGTNDSQPAGGFGPLDAAAVLNPSLR